MGEIDRRAMSRMPPDIKLVHMRLEQWARWAKDKPPNGWPERTILGRLIEEGPGASHCTSFTSDIPDHIAHVDRAVGHLSHDDKRVIRAYYLSWMPREFLAIKLRISPRRLDTILNRARWRIAGFLSAC